RNADSLVNISGCPTLGLGNAYRAQQLGEQLAVLGEVYVLNSCAQHTDFCLLEWSGEVYWSLAAKLDYDAIRLLFVDDVQDVLNRERFEVQAVTGVNIRAHRLRDVVDDD